MREPTYVSVSVDLRVAHVTNGVVHDGLGFWLNNGRSRNNRGLTGFPLAFSTEDGMEDDTIGLVNFEELMSHCMVTPLVSNA